MTFLTFPSLINSATLFKLASSPFNKFGKVFIIFFFIGFEGTLLLLLFIINDLSFRRTLLLLLLLLIILLLLQFVKFVSSSKLLLLFTFKNEFEILVFVIKSESVKSKSSVNASL